MQSKSAVVIFNFIIKLTFHKVISEMILMKLKTKKSKNKNKQTKNYL